MADFVLDARGLKCPQPQLRMSIQVTKMKAGEVLEVVADCDTFEQDIRNWCVRNKKSLLWMKAEGEHGRRCQIRL